MGRPKMSLPWGNTTVIGQVLITLARAGLQDILVVTGGGSAELLDALARLPGEVRYHTVFNPEYSNDEMSGSLKVGLSALGSEIQAAMVVLGDQPQIEAEVVQTVLSAYRTSHAALVIPSHQMRRGHPWILARALWPEIQALRPPSTLRQFLNAHADSIHYVNVDTPSILKDLDTPQQYQESKPATD